MLNHVLRPVARNVARSGSRAYHPPANFKQTTMNDLPTPQGSWQAYHDAQQRKYNRHLAIGVVTFVATCVAAKSSGLIFFNWNPPTPQE